jgi:small GTP-binding protein
VYKNQKAPGVGKNVLISPKAFYEELLAQCCLVLGGSYNLIYNDQGKQVTSVKALNDGCSLYCSKGEAFQVVKKVAESREPAFVMLGSAGVGKSAITLRYIRNLFVDDYDPTIEDFYKHTAMVRGQTQNVSILDTAGMEDYDPLVEEWIDQKQGIFFIFSLELEDSIKKIEDYYQKVNHKYQNQTRPVIALVGNKNDLRRVVPYDSGRRLAERIKCKYYEVSAFTGEGIKPMFEEMITEIKNRQKPQSVPWYRRCCLL